MEPRFYLPQTVRIRINGKNIKYESYAEAARAYNVKPGTLSLRLKKGWTIYQALGLLPPPKNANVLKKIQVGDITFNSISDASKHFEIKTSIVSSRLRKGWTEKQALGLDTQPPKKKPEGKKISLNVNGEDVFFATITDAARHYGIRPSLAMQRLVTYAWTPEQAFGLEMPPRYRPKKITLKQGNRILIYESLKAATDAFNLNYDIVKQRINKLGWTPEQALELETPPKHEKGCIGYIYKVTNIKANKVYIGQTKSTVKIRWQQHIEKSFQAKYLTQRSLHNAIQKYGVDSFTCEALDSANTINDLNRLERQHIINHKSLNPDFGYNLSRGGSGLTGGTRVTVRGEKFDSLNAAARSYKIKPGLAHQRINTNGWTIEQALEIDRPPKGSSGPKFIIVRDKGIENKFPSQISAAKQYGVDYKIFHSRIHSGWTIEQALELVNRPDRTRKGKTIKIKCKGKLKIFNSVAEAAREFGLPRSRVQARIDRGWSLEQALEVE